MLDWLKGFFELFERVLFGELNAHDDGVIKNQYPFSKHNLNSEITYSCSESDSSESDSDNYNYIRPNNGYKITRRNVAFC